jgi:hypothetical protein
VSGSAKGEGVGRNAKVEEGDLEGALGDAAELADDRADLVEGTTRRLRARRPLAVGLAQGPERGTEL